MRTLRRTRRRPRDLHRTPSPRIPGLAVVVAHVERHVPVTSAGDRGGALRACAGARAARGGASGHDGRGCHSSAARRARARSAARPCRVAGATAGCARSGSTSASSCRATAMNVDARAVALRAVSRTELRGASVAESARCAARGRRIESCAASLSWCLQAPRRRRAQWKSSAGSRPPARRRREPLDLDGRDDHGGALRAR